MFNLSAIVGSAILYGDFRRATFHQIVTFLYGCTATFAGVFIIAWGPSNYSADQEDMGSEDREDLEAAATVHEDGIIPRELRMGSLSRRDRPTLVIPEGVIDSVASTPILRSQQSLVSMIGLSPAQVSNLFLSRDAVLYRLASSACYWCTPRPATNSFDLCLKIPRAA